MPAATSRRVVCLAVLLTLVALATSGCGGGTKSNGATTGGTQTNSATTSGTQTNGLENKSAAQVQQDAAAALKAAKSVHAAGTGTSEGQAVRVDLRIQGGSLAGTIEQGGGRFEFISIGNDTYFRADEGGMKLMGVPPAIQRLAAGRWAKLSSKQMNFQEFSLDSLAAELTNNTSTLASTVEQATLDGNKVVVVSQQDGSKLYVANTGPAYPLRTDSTGTDPGRLDFTEYGVDFHITAPSNAVDITKLG
jgi:hypothetical protein